MSKSSQHNWSNEELTIAYYIAKWDCTGLKMSESELVDYVIGESTVPSLKMQVANFRYLMGIEGYQLSGGEGKVSMKLIVDDMANKTVTQVRKIVLDYIDSCSEIIGERTVNTHNKVVDKKRKAANAQLELDFDNKLKYLKKYRNLRKK